MAFLDDLIGEPMTFASTLRAIRETDNLTQAGVAKMLKMTRAHICDIEKGRKLVSPERAAKFARALGYSPAQFVRLALQDQVRAAGLDMTVKVEAA
jgi:transcriptional regulator with XRE-family HTH domain